MILDSDTLWKSAIRRQMGFDFTLEQQPRRFVVTDLETNLQAFAVKPQGLVNEKAVNNLVRACMRLKKKHDEQIRKV